MECKKCGIDLAGKEYKNVAQWPFCLECFQALMDKAEEKKAESIAMPVPKTAIKKQHCMICEKEIGESAGHEMLGLIFCNECYENLVRKPDIPPRIEGAGREQGPDPMEKQPVMQVRVDLKSQIQCYSCGRRIPAVGSKQFGDHAYCPDCYYKLPEIEAQKAKPFPSSVSASPPHAEASHPDAGKNNVGLACQACQRPVLPENLRTVEGFEICLACLSTDRNAALEIARAHHRQTLEKIKKELA
jgi:hypothetical protein